MSGPASSVAASTTLMPSSACGVMEEAKHNDRAVDRLVTALADAVGPHHVLTDPELCASYETDWTGRFAGRAKAVVRPGNTDEVAAVMALLSGAGRPVVPQGGNSG